MPQAGGDAFADPLVGFAAKEEMLEGAREALRTGELPSDSSGAVLMSP